VLSNLIRRKSEAWGEGDKISFAAGIGVVFGAPILVIIRTGASRPGDDDVQTAVSTNCVLHGINLKNSRSLERECGSYNVFAMLLDTLLNKLVRTVDVSASWAIQTIGVSIDVYVEIRFNPGSLLRRNRSKPTFARFRAVSAQGSALWWSRAIVNRLRRQYRGSKAVD